MRRALAAAVSVGVLAGCATVNEQPSSNIAAISDTAAVSTSTTTTMPESTTTTTPPPPTTTPPPTTLPSSLGPTYLEFRWANANSDVLQGFAGALMFFALEADAYSADVAAAPTAAEAKRTGALFSAACDASDIAENPANRSLALVCAVARATVDAIELAEAGSTAEAARLLQPFADDRNSVSIASGVLISADTAG